MLFRSAALATAWEEALHSLRRRRHVIDVRNLGLVGGIELEPRTGAVGARAFETFLECFKGGVLIRVTGDVIALSPPLIVNEDQIGEIVETIARALDRVA